MNALLVLLTLATSVCLALAFPKEGPAAVLFCASLAAGTAYWVSRHRTHGRFLVHVFVSAVLLRVVVGSAIHHFGLQDFFGGDAVTYDYRGWALLEYWRGGMRHEDFERYLSFYLYRNWGMPYMVAGVYWLVGRNVLAVQYLNALLGAATAPVIFLCARHIFQNLRVAKVAALFVAFFPSLILWSSQALKDGPIVFLLAAAMLATLRLGERLSAQYLAVLLFALYGLLSLRFYVFYVTLAAVLCAFVIGMRPQKTTSLVRQFAVIMVLGLALTYLGVLRTASVQFETYGNLQVLQNSRSDLVQSAASGFGQDVDVSTTEGALSAIPVGATYLLFAPFPWQVANLRQSITIPEMVVWWASFPLLVVGIWFTVK
ncbi:MAG TPA: glycosyltransferase family 39 protein, partial [Pyrinomonadaceae bacterium]